MLGYEPPRPRLWKALIAAAVIVFPLLYLGDVVAMHHQPGWVYVIVASAISAVIGYQMYSGVGQWSTGWLGRSSKAAASLVPKRQQKSGFDNARNDE